MKISLALGRRGNLSPQTAWGCLTANLAVPGAGSLAGGRISGYPQLLLAMAGFVLTVFFGGKFILWYIQNYSKMREVQTYDPLEPLLQVWLEARWSLLGIALFALAWLWALTTGLSITREARKANKPPLLS